MNVQHLFSAPACAIALALSISATVGEAQTPDMDHAHHHHDDAPESLEKLGHVHFPVSCADAQRAPFERGIALLHSFGYVETAKQFRAIVDADPKCAMAHWGVAMTQYHELWGRPDEAAVTTGQEEMAKAEALAASEKVVPREKAYIDALNGFYLLAGTDFQKAADGYAASMKALHEAYPDDVEGAAFYALSVIASEAPDDTSLNKERTALAVLIPLFKANPEHPGLAHYIIHTCDTPKLAAQGLDAAKVYARIAPSSAHALHMPGHIFARLGMWPEDIESNEKSVAASQRAIAAGQPGGAHQMHAEEFLIYAYLQVGEDEKAHKLVTNMRSVSEQMAAMPGMDDMKNEGAGFDNEVNAIYALEMHNWAAAEALQAAPKSSSLEYIWWANGIAAGRVHEKKPAEKALKLTNKDVAKVAKGKHAYRLVYLNVYRDELEGWTRYAEDKPEEALAAMRRAADQQDKLGQAEVDIPAREMLGDLLMTLHQPQEALAEYRVALTLSPNRLNGLLSAGAAEEALGNRSEATRYYTAAARNTNNSADSKRPELLHAVAFVKQPNGAQAE